MKPQKKTLITVLARLPMVAVARLKVVNIIGNKKAYSRKVKHKGKVSNE